MDKQNFDRFRQYNLPRSVLDSFRSERDAALVGASIARRRGWEVGKEVDLRGQLGIVFRVKAIFFTGSEEHDNTVLAGYEYVQDSKNTRGLASMTYLKLKDGVNAEERAKMIDAMPLSTRTKTRPETAFVSGMLEDLGDMIALSHLVIVITLLVVFMSVANAVSMSVRDRTRQLGVMRTLGYGRRAIITLVLAESAAVALVAGCVAIGFAVFVFEAIGVTLPSRTFRFDISLPWRIIPAALGVALFVGLAGALLPALRAARLNIVEALRTVD